MRRVRLVVSAGADGSKAGGRPPGRPRLWLACGLLTMLAAGAAGGAVAGRMLAPREALRSDAAAVLAGGELARALERDAAGATDDPRPVRLGATFRSRDGAWCRVFSMREGGGVAGVACREAQRWRIHLLTRTPRTAETRMRAAAPEIPPAVRREAAQMMRGDPLAPAASAAVRRRGWR